MAWVRIDDGAMGHPKILALSDSAFRLWIKGLVYCQKHLTDGLIPRAALPEMKPKRQDVDALATSVAEGYAPLWETIDGFGFKVHDYLFWNDSREKVRERQEKEKKRKENWRRNAAKNATEERVPDGGTDASRNTRSGAGDALRLNQTKPNQTNKEREEARASSDPKLGERAAAFIERYPSLYAKCRSGASYRVLESRDFDAFVDLVDREPDDRRLDQLCELFLTVKSRDFLNSPGTPRQFVHMFPECDRLLRENGR